MIYKDRLTNPMTTLLRKESFSKQYYQSGITSSKGLNFYQVIFLMFTKYVVKKTKFYSPAVTGAVELVQSIKASLPEV